MHRFQHQHIHATSSEDEPEGTSECPTRYRMQTSRAAANHSDGHAHVGDLRYITLN